MSNCEYLTVVYYRPIKDFLAPSITVEPVDSAILPDEISKDPVSDTNEQRQELELETVQPKPIIYDYEDDSDDLETPNDRRHQSSVSLEQQNIEIQPNQTTTMNNESNNVIDQGPIIGDFEDDSSDDSEDENQNNIEPAENLESEHDEEHVVKSEELQNFTVGEMIIPQISFLKSMSVEESKIPFEPISGSVVVDPQAGEISMKVILNPLDLIEEISEPMKALYDIQDVREETLLSKM